MILDDLGVEDFFAENSTSMTNLVEFVMENATELASNDEEASLLKSNLTSETELSTDSKGTENLPPETENLDKLQNEQASMAPPLENSFAELSDESVMVGNFKKQKPGISN